MLSSVLSGLRQMVSAPDVAVDLGTANTRLYARGYGLIADEPSIIKVHPETGAVEAVGNRAVQMDDPHDLRRPISPLHAGVVTDVEAAALLLKPFLRRARRFSLSRSRVLACVPTDACQDEQAALIEAALRAGASAVALAPEPLAAAIGAGLDISSPYAQMLVDIGDGVTDIAVTQSGELIATHAVRTACSDLHAAISKLMVERFGVELYPREAERLTRKIGAAVQEPPATMLMAMGTERGTGREKVVCINSREIAQALAPVINTIVEAILTALSKLSPKTSCEVIESGLCLTGGGACLKGLPELISKATSLEVRVATDPLRAVINGARQMLLVGAATHLWLN